MSTAKRLYAQAAYLRHLGGFAKDEYSKKPKPTAADVTEKAIQEHLFSCDCGRDNAIDVCLEELVHDYEMGAMLHERLIDAAKDCAAAAQKIEDAEESVGYADDFARSIKASAMKADWYDEAYQSFCDVMVGAILED